MLRDHPGKAAEYPNGRALIDHVVAARLALISNNGIPNDGLRPHDDLLEEFPYLGTPHSESSATAAAPEELARIPAKWNCFADKDFAPDQNVGAKYRSRYHFRLLRSEVMNVIEILSWRVIGRKPGSTFPDHAPRQSLQLWRDLL